MVVGNQQNHTDHDIALTNLLETARRSNIHLNYDKLHYKAIEEDFFRETYTTDGCKPAQNKISVITEKPPPTCKKQVQSFIGMINYLSKFSARLLELAEPIRELCKEKVPFNWGLEHHTAFKQIKKIDCQSSHTSLLQSQKRNNRCKHQRARCVSATGPKTSLLCEQSTYRDPKRLCCHRN